jgi:hypothetical protein
LRCHEQHAVHDYDDDCEEAANEIERLTAEGTRKDAVIAAVRRLFESKRTITCVKASDKQWMDKRCTEIVAALTELDSGRE